MFLAAFAICLTVRQRNPIIARDAGGTLTVEELTRHIFRVRYVPTGIAPRPTDMLVEHPEALLRSIPDPTDFEEGPLIFTRPGVNDRTVVVGDPRAFSIERAALARGEIALTYHYGGPLYGMRATQLNFRPSDNRGNPGIGLTRESGAQVKAGSQGDAGAPLAYTNHWGLLVDSIDGSFKTEPNRLVFSGGSRKDLEFYVFFGPPKYTMNISTALTGRPPMPPRWSLGFMNSQWGTDQATATRIVDEYRRRHIPLDSFIFDFDFKAWGEDNYGEWRWNSTFGPGNVGPMKYPDGASGKFAKEMAGKGIKLSGIMKLRILMKNADGTTMKAAAEADAHHWWLPGKRPYTDYFSHRPADDLDFSNPDCRAWYWKHAKGLFDTGIVGWWNDEADDGFDSLGFFHMQQSLYEGQRRDSNTRVWSLNRNFYLGAQRFGFGTWSGDIRSGFPSMASQSLRMLATIDLGQPHWSMDTGGFNGHPSPENYARWMEFASVVPIMRVHGTFGERRQPWVYGPVAEAAAKKAIEWRYSMIPSLYSWEHKAHETGVGIVRPLFWEFPDDPGSANITDEWMLGDGLLVAPVLEEGAKLRTVYLPPGKWINRDTGAEYPGNATFNLALDDPNWQAVPMFVRAGTILASQPVTQYVGEHPVTELTLDIWPDAYRPATFTVYDDDGQTYRYERGDYFSQTVTANVGAITLGVPEGHYRTAIKTYRVRLHLGPGIPVRNLTFPAGKPQP